MKLSLPKTLVCVCVCVSVNVCVCVYVQLCHGPSSGMLSMPKLAHFGNHFVPTMAQYTTGPKVAENSIPVP